MKAAIVREFGPIESLQIGDARDPAPAPDEIVLQVAAAEVNYADYLVIEGKYQVKPPLPFSPGKTAAGTVVAVGSSVKEFAVGMRVGAHVEYGAFAERLCAKSSQCFPVPADVSFDDAVALGLAYQTAWFALKSRARIERGESVLVLGAAGGVGMAGVQLARAFGAGPVIAVTRKSRARALQEIGADHIIDVAVHGSGDALRSSIRELTHGKGADIVLDPVGGQVGEAALRGLAWSGRYVVIGFAAGPLPPIKPGYLLVKNISVHGIQWLDFRDRSPHLVRSAQQEMFDLLRRGQVKPHVSQRISFAQLPFALATLRDGRADGRFVLGVGSVEVA